MESDSSYRMHTTRFLDEMARIATQLDSGQLDRLAKKIAEIRDARGRVFVLGLGGSAANASHAACDLRGLANVDAHAPSDASASFTAAANDFGWAASLRKWLAPSELGSKDLVIVLSVGGGSRVPPVSENLVEAMEFARDRGAYLVAVVGPRGGEAATLADECVTVPVVDRAFETTHTEIYQAVVWHLLVTHPSLRARTPHWESLDAD